MKFVLLAVVLVVMCSFPRIGHCMREWFNCTDSEEYSLCVTGCDPTCIWRIHGLCPHRLKKCREGCACRDNFISFSVWDHSCIPVEYCEQIRQTLDKKDYY